MKRTPKKLYNLIFPIWFFWMIPSLAWLLILPANFLVDSLVLLVTAHFLRLEQGKRLWKKSILKIWLIGFASDFAGAVLCLIVMMVLGEFLDTHAFNPYFFPGATLHAIPGVLLAGVMIYFLNRKYSFRGFELPPEILHKLSLALAVLTAPYLMMIPLYYR